MSLQDSGDNIVFLRTKRGSFFFFYRKLSQQIKSIVYRERLRRGLKTI